MGERERRENAPKSRCWASLVASFFLNAAIAWHWSSDEVLFEPNLGGSLFKLEVGCKHEVGLGLILRVRDAPPFLIVLAALGCGRG